MEKHDLRRLQIEDLKLIGPLLGHWISFYFTNLLIPLHSCNIWLIGGGIDGCIDHFSMQNRVTHHIYISFRPDWHLPSNVWLCLCIRDMYHPISYVLMNMENIVLFFIFYFPFAPYLHDRTWPMQLTRFLCFSVKWMKWLLPTLWSIKINVLFYNLKNQLDDQFVTLI